MTKYNKQNKLEGFVTDNRCKVRYGDQIIIDSDSTESNGCGRYGCRVGIVDDTHKIMVFTHGKYNVTPIYIRPAVGSSRKTGDYVYWNDRIVLAQTSSAGKTDNCGWYGCRVADMVDRALKFNHGGDAPKTFYLRQPVGGSGSGGSSLQYHDKFVLAETSSSGNTSNCGIYGCRVYKMSGSSGTFGHGKSDPYAFYARPTDPDNDMKRDCGFNGETLIYNNGKYQNKVSGSGTNALYESPSPTKSELDTKKSELDNKKTKLNKLKNTWEVNYENNQKGLNKEIQSDKSTINNNKSTNKAIINNYNDEKKQQKEKSNDIQNTMDTYDFEPFTQKELNNIEDIREIHTVNSQTAEIKQEINKKQQTKMTYEHKSHYQKDEMEKYRFLNQYVLVFIYYILACIGVFYIFNFDTTISRKLIYFVLLFTFPFIIYPIEKGLYYIYNYLTSFIIAEPHDQ